MSPYQSSFWLFLYIIFYFVCSNQFLSDYSGIAQAPETGVHSIRIGPFALIDVTATALLALIVTFIYYYRCGGKIVSVLDFYYIFVVVFILLVFISVPIHELFGVNTKLIKMINHVR